MNRDLIERYAAGAEAPARAIVGLTAEDLDAFPVPGTWSIRQIIVHLMDSDLVGGDRMKRVAAEDNPTLLAYDENAFVARLGYDQMDAPLSCEVFCVNRMAVAHMLRRLPDAAFERAGMHTERGRETLGELVALYIEHLEHHLAFIRKKRELLGKPLTPPDPAE